MLENEKSPEHIGPLHSAVRPSKFQPIVTKRSFHIKQNHELINLRRQKQALLEAMMEDPIALQTA